MVSEKPQAGFDRALLDGSWDLLLVSEVVRDVAGQIVDFACVESSEARAFFWGGRDPRGARVSAIWPDAGPESLAVWRDVLLRGEPLVYEHTRDGQHLLLRVFRLDSMHVGCGVLDVTHLGPIGARHRLLAEHTTDVIWVFDLRSLRLTYVSPSVLTLRGVTVEQALQESLEQAFTPESLEQIVDLIARVGTDRELTAHTGVYQQYCADGSVKDLELTTRLLRDAEGAPMEVVGISRDVTDRVRAERALRESEERLRTIFEMTLAGIIVVRLSDQRLVSVNEAWASSLGYARDEVVGRTSVELDIYADPAQREILGKDLRARGELRSMEARLRRKDGSEGDFILTAGLAEIGGESCVIGLFHEITELRASDRARLESERLLRAVLETAADGFAVVDDCGRFLEVNAAFSRISGYSQAELLELDLIQLEGEPDHGITRQMRRVIGDGSDRFESRHRRKDGSIIDVEVSVGFLDDEGRRFLLVVRDVTEQKRARQGLERSEQRFRALIEKSSDLILLLDEEARCQFASPVVEEALGYGASALAGRSVFDFVFAEDAPGLREAWPDLLRGSGRALELSLRFRAQNGRLSTMECAVRNLLDDPAVRAIVVNARDVTRQRELEEQFRQAQKLESVGRLAGGIAHDFNNLLTVILSCAETAKDDLELGQAVSSEDLEQIHAAGERAKELTNQLLAFARKQVIKLVPVDLNAVVRGSEKILRRLLGEDVELLTELQPGLFLVKADPGQLEQVILNLAINARDAMPRGGLLRVATENVGDTSGERVRLVLRDTGTGMTDEVRSHLFEPFFTTKEPGKGTGLGLATVYGIVQQAGGSISVKSALGHGSEFTLEFPRAVATRQPTSPPPSVPSSGSERVLVVEDDPLVRAITVRALRQAGYRVLVASDGEEALAVAQNAGLEIDLLLTDVVLPNLDGRALLEALRRERAALRCLFVSGYTADIIGARGVVESGIELLPKPYTARTLLTRVRDVLDAR
ncbi:MAG: PAS domain S-box protein [Polyangiaceae bacterium]